MWKPDADGIETKVFILFETDGSSRDHMDGASGNTEYEFASDCDHFREDAGQPGRPRLPTASMKRPSSSSSSKTDLGCPMNTAVDRVIEELLPVGLQDFFVMDADEAADFVGGSENKVIQRRDVIAKTSFAVRALLGLEIFETATDRIQTLARSFGRSASKASGDQKLNERQAELDRLHRRLTDLDKKLKEKPLREG